MMRASRTATARYFACSRCGSPNPVRGDASSSYVVCHACDAPTPGPSSQRSARLLSHGSGETCPFFCEESKTSRHRLCSHTSAEVAALAEAPPLPWAALAGVFGLAALLSASLLLVVIG